jgi:hypothetical protein
MVLFTLDKTSVDSTVSYIDHLQERILVGVRVGMKDGVKGLAQAEVEAAAAHPSDPRSKPNDMLANILGRSGRVIETDDDINAIYKPRNAGKQAHYWLEYGYHVPAVGNTVMNMIVGMRAPGVYRAHKEFSVPARPFFFSIGEGYQGQFFEKIQARVREAMSA